MRACGGALRSPAVPTGNGHQPEHIRLPLNTRSHLFFTVCAVRCWHGLSRKLCHRLWCHKPHGMQLPLPWRSAWHPGCLRPEPFCERGRGKGKKGKAKAANAPAAPGCQPLLPTRFSLPAHLSTSASGGLHSPLSPKPAPTFAFPSEGQKDFTHNLPRTKAPHAGAFFSFSVSSFPTAG